MKGRRVLGWTVTAVAVLTGVALVPVGFLLYADLHGLPVWDVVRTRVIAAAAVGLVAGLLVLARWLAGRR